jgi:hypothetical protein
MGAHPTGARRASRAQFLQKETSMKGPKGEGNRAADRDYRERSQEAMDKGDTKKHAKEAAKAVRGDEKEELERAEEAARKGPKKT